MQPADDAGSAAFTDIEEDPNAPYPEPDLTEDEVDLSDLTDEDTDDGSFEGQEEL